MISLFKAQVGEFVYVRLRCWLILGWCFETKSHEVERENMYVFMAYITRGQHTEWVYTPAAHDLKKPLKIE